MKQNHYSRLGVIVGSLALVTWLSSQFLNQILFLYLGSQRGLFTPIVIFASILSIISAVLNKRIRRNQALGFLVIILLATYGITVLLQPGKSNLKPADFFGMCILPLLFGGILVVDYKLTFKLCMTLLVVAIPVFSQLFVKANYSLTYDAVSMSTSYDILSISIFGIIHFIYFRKDSSLFEKTLYALSLFFILSLIRLSYRGPLLALYTAVVSALNFQKKENNNKKLIKLLVLSVFVFVVILNFKTILTGLSILLAKANIRVAFIDKSLFLLQQENFGQGRIETYKAALSGFLASPLWGHGMATFSYYTGIVFPHNFILEFLFDGGLLLFIPLCLVFYQALRNLFSRVWDEERSRFALILMIGSISICRGLISAESWRLLLLWLFIGLCLNNEQTVVLRD